MESLLVPYQFIFHLPSNRTKVIESTWSTEKDWKLGSASLSQILSLLYSWCRVWDQPSTLLAINSEG